jgi:hypothetical protein
MGVGRFLPFVHADGSVLRLHLTISEKKDDRGKALYFIGILTRVMNAEEPMTGEQKK